MIARKKFMGFNSSLVFYHHVLFLPNHSKKEASKKNSPRGRSEFVAGSGCEGAFFAREGRRSSRIPPALHPERHREAPQYAGSAGIAGGRLGNGIMEWGVPKVSLPPFQSWSSKWQLTFLPLTRELRNAWRSFFFLCSSSTVSVPVEYQSGQGWWKEKFPNPAHSLLPPPPSCLLFLILNIF